MCVCEYSKCVETISLSHNVIVINRGSLILNLRVYTKQMLYKGITPVSYNTLTMRILIRL